MVIGVARKLLVETLRDRKPKRHSWYSKSNKEPKLVLVVKLSSCVMVVAII
jgi:hypothetical protein